MEADVFREQCNALGDAYQLDEALRILTYEVSRRPEIFDAVPGTRLRIAKTDRFVGPRGITPRLKLYFTIPNDHKVLLLWLEEDLEERP